LSLPERTCRYRRPRRRGQFIGIDTYEVLADAGLSLQPSHSGDTVRDFERRGFSIYVERQTTQSLIDFMVGASRLLQHRTGRIGILGFWGRLHRACVIGANS